MRIKDNRIVSLSRKLALFTDPVRLRIFFFLFSSQKGDLCVSDVAKYLGSSLSNTSHQLRKLELAGIVGPKRDGRMICYRAQKTDDNIVLYNCLNKLIKR